MCRMDGNWYNVHTFLIIGDIEKKHKLEISPLCDRASNTVGNIQIGQYLCWIPIYLVACKESRRVVSIRPASRPYRLHDVRGGAAVRGVGPFFRHPSVPDHAGPHGAEQGQLGRPATGTNVGRRGDGARRGQCRRYRCPERRQRVCGGGRKRLQRNTSGKQRMLTVMACSWRRPQGLATHTGGQVEPPDANTYTFCCFCLPSR